MRILFDPKSGFIQNIWKMGSGGADWPGTGNMSGYQPDGSYNQAAADAANPPQISAPAAQVVAPAAVAERKAQAPQPAAATTGSSSSLLGGAVTSNVDDIKRTLKSLLGG